MSFYGGVWTACYGPTMYQFSYITGERIGNTITITAYVLPEFRERYYYLILNGVYVDSYYCDAVGVLKCVVPPAFGNSVDSVYLADGGLVGSPSEEALPIITYNAQQQATKDAKSIKLNWDCEGQYTVSPVAGTDQLTDVTITGAVRGKNCEKLNLLPSRGRLQVTVSNSGSTRTVRLYNAYTLVAEGSRTGDGLLTVSPVGTTGIQMECTVTYTDNTVFGSCWIDLQWPVGWYIHCSTSALSYPRTAEFYKENTGGDNYEYLIMSLAAGVYNVAITAIDDEGQESLPLTFEGSPFTIKSTPGAPTITSVVETSPYNFTVNFTNSDASAVSHTVYFSNVNDAVNGVDPSGCLITGGPAPVVTATNSAAITINAYTPQDYTTDYNTLVSGIESAVNYISGGYASGETGFSANLATQITNIQNAVDTFGDELGLTLMTIKADLLKASTQMQAVADGLEGNGYLTDEWQSYIAPSLAIFYQFLGVMIDDNGARFVLPGFGLSNEQYTELAGGLSLYEIAEPLVRKNLVRILVRAKNASGYEEQNGNMFTLELDNSGSKLQQAPNDPVIESITIDPATELERVGEEEAAAITNSNTLTWTHTILDGSSRGLAIYVMQTGGNFVTSVTLNGSSVGGQSGGYTSASGGQCLIYFFPSPPVGSSTLAINVDGTASNIAIYGLSVQYNGLHQSNPFADETAFNMTNVDNGSHSEPTTSVGDQILGYTLLGSDSTKTITEGSNLDLITSQVRVESASFSPYGFDLLMYERVTPDASPITSSASAVSDYYDMAAVTIHAASATPQVTLTASYYVDDEDLEADYLDFYIEEEDGSYSFSTPDSSVEIDATFNVGKYSATATLASPASSGFIKVAVKSRNSTTGKRSDGYAEFYLNLDSSVPEQPNNAIGNIQGGRGM